MQLIKPRPSRDLDNALIPLINVVFLMMIFFMLAGQIRPPEALAIDPPRSAQARAETSGSIQLLVGANGQLALDGDLVTLAQLAERIEAYRTQAGADAGPTTDPGHPESILLKADAGVRHGRLREVIAALHSAGIGHVGLLAEPASN